MPIRLTKRDEELLDALTRRVRFFAIDQVAKCWWSEAKSPISRARKRVNELLDSGYLNCSSVFAQRLINVVAPVCTWQPGACPPDLASAAYRLQSRWNEPAKRFRVYTASSLTTKRFNGRRPRGIKRQFQLSHDIGLSDVFCVYCLRDKDATQKWWGEDQIGAIRVKKKLPDAIICDTPSWPPQLIVEFGGRYDKSRLSDFFEFCKREHLPFEIW